MIQNGAAQPPLVRLGVANPPGPIAWRVVDLGIPGFDRQTLLVVAWWSRCSDSGSFVALNAGLQSNAALLIDKLLGLRNPSQHEAQYSMFQGSKTHLSASNWSILKGRAWYELDLAALVADEAF